MCFPFAAIFVFMLVSSLVFESISFRGFYWGPLLIRVRFLFTFVGVLLLARVDAYARLNSVWGCFVECGAMNLSTGVRAVQHFLF